MKCIDEAQPSSSLLKTIQREFLLSEELARKYCAIVFLASQRFELSKKKLVYLKFVSKKKFTRSALTINFLQFPRLLRMR